MAASRSTAGAGILPAAAALLGADRVLACDTDAEAAALPAERLDAARAAYGPGEALENEGWAALLC